MVKSNDTVYELNALSIAKFLKFTFYGLNDKPSSNARVWLTYLLYAETLLHPVSQYDPSDGITYTGFGRNFTDGIGFISQRVWPNAFSIPVVCCSMKEFLSGEIYRSTNFGEIVHVRSFAAFPSRTAFILYLMCFA
jgi:hypothetical protein